MNLYNILNTGDIILFEGYYIVSKIIEFLTESNYSHIGIIIKNPKFLDKNFKNGLGVVLDDLIAAIFAACLSSLITIYLI